MSGYIFTNPIFKTKVLTYERLAFRTDDVWFREYHLFASEAEIEEDLSHYKNSLNIRNAEVYDVVIDLTKPIAMQTLPTRTCKGCGEKIDGNNKEKRPTICDNDWYCDYDCYCKHNPDKVKRLLET